MNPSRASRLSCSCEKWNEREPIIAEALFCPWCGRDLSTDCLKELEAETGYPVTEMIQRGWLGAPDVKQRASVLEALHRFFDVDDLGEVLG